MDPYAITRRSPHIPDTDMSAGVRLIRSYVLDDGDGACRTVCIYEAASEEAMREYAFRAGLPTATITPIAETVVARPDPRPWTDPPGLPGR